MKIKERIINAKITLPEGFTVRPATMDDIPATVEMYNLWAEDVLGYKEIGEEEVRNEWESPVFDPEKNARLVFSPDGTLVGYGEAWTNGDTPVRPWIWARVHPSYQNLGIGIYLTQWAEGFASQVLEKLPEHLRVCYEVGVDSRVKAAKELFEDLGYAYYRSYYQMRITMDAPPPAPRWPDGLVLKPFDPKRDLEAVYLADEDAFKDHHGYVEESFEVGFPRFKHHFTQTDNYDPTLWFIVWDGDEIAGINICRPYSHEDENMGWVSTLGVRRPWRKKGLGLALLLHSFGEFYSRGKKKVGLGVDSGSLTGALNLYKKAGMAVYSQFDKYAKEIRAGEEISVQSIEE